MNSKTKTALKIGSIVFAAVLAAVTIALVIYGNVTHSETVFLAYCVNGDRIEYFQDVEGADIEGTLVDAGFSCERQNDPLWTKSSFPLTVHSVSDSGGVQPEDHVSWRVLKQAISDANSQFGFRVFALADRTKGSVVQYQWGAPYTNERNGKAEGYVNHYYYDSNAVSDLVSGRRNGDQNGLAVKVGVRDVSSDRVAYIITMHELGHVLFLGHDDYTSSVMYPLSFDDTNSAFLLNWTRFADADTDAIHSRFAD